MPTRKYEPGDDPFLEDVTDVLLEAVRSLAKAPAEDDSDWVVVSGPGW